MREMLIRYLCILVLFLLSACQGLSPQTLSPTLQPSATPAPSQTPTSTATPSPTATYTPTPSATPTITDTPTITLTPTITPTPTITFTPTPDYPDVTVKMQANCRYGPGTAYLYRWGLYPGDTADVRGKNWNGTWFWIHPSNLPDKQNCWASEIVFNETVDKASVNTVQVPLPHTTFAGPPGNVQAVRDGDKVTVSWSVVPLSDDKRRGYLIEAYVCQNSSFIFMAVQTDNTSYTFKDASGCKTKSNGLLYTAEKHGYSDPVQIPWP